MAAAFSSTGGLAATQVFTPQYADDEQQYSEYDDPYESVAVASAAGVASSPVSPVLHYVDEHGGVEYFEDGEDATAAADMLDEQLEDEQLLDEESARAHAAHKQMVQAARLSPQDYIPSKIVGHTYGTEAWQLHRPPAPLELLPYVKTGSNGVFEARPVSVEFAGYHVGDSYTQVLSLLNISDRAQRLHILPPLTSAFKVTYSKKGSVAPGMAEQVAITFEPAAYRFYEDGLRIHCLGENLLVPLLAYPTLNRQKRVFPTALSMGPSVGVGRRATRRVQLVCDVPVQFEFELTLLNPSTDFSVFPLRGIVPANGTTTISIDFSPKRPVTSLLQLQVNISQFGFKPFVATVSGSGHILQLDLPVAKQKPVLSLRQKRLQAAKHLQQMEPTKHGASTTLTHPLSRPKAAGAKV